MDMPLILELISVSLVASIISSLFIQKIKEIYNFNKIFIKVLALLISFILGFLYALSFYSDNMLYNIWIGLFTSIGAEKLYSLYQNKFNLTNKK